MRAALPAAVLVAVLAAWAVPAEAAGRRPYGGTLRVAGTELAGWRDAHAARSTHERALVAWTHCGLLRMDEEGRLRPELAVGPGRFEDGVLRLELVGGATFHDGSAVTADDVVASLGRLVRVRRGDALGRLLGAVDARAVDLATVDLRPPAGTDPAVLRRLLARPEVAVLKEGTPGRGQGCGAFRPAGRSAGALALEAHPGHPRGRPWVDAVRLVRVDGAREERAALRFGEVDVADRRSPWDEEAQTAPTPRRETLFAVPHPRWRGGGGEALRRAVVTLAGRARLARHQDAPARTATSPWPPDLAPTAAEVGPPARTPTVGGLVVAWPAARPELAEVARALRDALRPLSDGPVRAVAAAEASLAEGLEAEDPPWDLLLAPHAWAALDAAQAAAELADVLGLEGPSARRVLAGRVGRAAAALVRDVAAVPVLHLTPAVHHRPDWRVMVDGAGLPVPGDSWRAP